jgi:hypothetical protein
VGQCFNENIGASFTFLTGAPPGCGVRPFQSLDCGTEPFPRTLDILQVGECGTFGGGFSKQSELLRVNVVNQ